MGGALDRALGEVERQPAGASGRPPTRSSRER